MTHFNKRGMLVGGRVGHIIVQGRDAHKVDSELTWKIAQLLVETGEVVT